MIRRIEYLDNVRALATLLLIPYHAARTFDWSQYFIKGAEPSTVEVWSGHVIRNAPSAIFESFTRMVDVWFMPVFFLVAGAASHISLERRSGRDFVIERARRLCIPMLIGLFLFMPFNGYFTHVSNSGWIGFWEYLPLFFEQASLEGFEGGFSVGHLWFLIYLFCFSLFSPLIHAHLFRHLPDARSLQTWVFCTALGVILCLARLTNLPYPNPLYFLAFYITGMYVLGNFGFAERILSAWKVLLALGIGTMTAEIMLQIVSNGWVTGHPVYESLKAINGFLWAFGILGLASVVLINHHKTLKSINHIGLWLYVVHMPVTTVATYFIVKEFQIAQPILAWILIVVIATPPTFFFAYVCEWVERKLRRLRHSPILHAAADPGGVQKSAENTPTDPSAAEPAKADAEPEAGDAKRDAPSPSDQLKPPHEGEPINDDRS